jgi:hypothetical protein
VGGTGRRILAAWTEKNHEIYYSNQLTDREY